MTCRVISTTLSRIFFFNDTATTEIYTLSLHDALPIWCSATCWRCRDGQSKRRATATPRSEEHTSELQSRQYIVCRLLLEKKKEQETYRADRPIMRWHLIHRIIITLP